MVSAGTFVARNEFPSTVLLDLWFFVRAVCALHSRPVRLAPWLRIIAGHMGTSEFACANDSSKLAFLGVSYRPRWLAELSIGRTTWTSLDYSDPIDGISTRADIIGICFRFE